jgi:drug/metabolite transporter (DMT)-like permease
MSDGRGPFLTPVHGTNREAFGPVDWGLFATAGLGFGSAFVFIALALDSLSPALITWIRAGSGALAILAFPQARRPIDRIDRWPVVLLSLVLVVLPLTLIPISLQWIDSALVGMLGGAMPIIATIISSVLLRTSPRRNQAVGVALGFVGVMLVSIPSMGQGSAAIAGIGLVLIATGSYALALNLAAPLQRKYGSATIMARCLLVSALITAPLAWLGRADSVFDWEAVLAIVFVGAFSTGLASVALGSLIGRAGAARASIVAYMVPVVAVLLGVLVRDESVNLVESAGIAAILLGAWLTSRTEL